MGKNIYYVSYSSYYSEIYNEVKICATEEEAQEVFDAYVEDVADSFGDEDRKEELIEEYKGKNYLHECAFGGTEFLVEISAYTLWK